MNGINHASHRSAVPARRRRFSLVEILFACLILMIMAVGGASFICHAISQLSIQQSRRLALEAANSRLEEVRSSAYANLKPPALTYQSYYLSQNAGNLKVSNGDPAETVLINGTPKPMTTTVAYADLDGGLSSYDALRVTVVVQYRGDHDTVCLETLCAP
jgi:type II secretory pathway pseudopilin PulG